MNPGLMASGSPAQLGGIEQHPQQTSSSLKPYLLKLKKRHYLYHPRLIIPGLQLYSSHLSNLNDQAKSNLCIITILWLLCWIKVIYKISTNTKFWKLPNFKHTNVFGQANKHANILALWPSEHELLALVTVPLWFRLTPESLIARPPRQKSGKLKLSFWIIILRDWWWFPSSDFWDLHTIFFSVFINAFSHFASFPLCLFYHFFSRLLPIKPFCFPKS